MNDILFGNNNKAIIKKLAKRTFHVNRSQNFLIAITAVIVTILLTASCSVLYNLQSFLVLQDLKEKGATTDVLLSAPSMEQMTVLEQSDLVSGPLYISYKLGRLIGNSGQAGLDVSMNVIENWEVWSRSLYSDVIGNYPKAENEIMMSTWMLKRLGIEPVIGNTVSLSVAWENTDAAQTEDFVLSGYYTDTSITNISSKQKIFLSAEKLAQHPTLAEVVGFSFSSGNFHNNLVAITEELGVETKQDVTVSGGVAGNFSMKNATIMLAVILFFMIDGFLIIYNINIVSVAKDIQFYGMLKTIGTTPMQLKRVIYYRMWRILLMAVPAGLVLGCLVSELIVPLLLGNILEGFSQTKFSVLIPIASAVFSCIMIWLSFYMPGRKLKTISAMDALRYTEKAGTLKKSRFNHHAKLPWMGLRNIFRKRQRACIVIGTFFLSSIAFLLCLTILNGMSVDEYIDYNTSADISLYNQMSRASFSPQEEQIFTPGLLEKLQTMDGVTSLCITKVVPIYEHFSEETYGEWLEIKNAFTQEMGAEPADTQAWKDSPKTMFWGLLIGIDSSVLEDYNQTATEKIDIAKFESGEFLLTTDINGNGLRVGDTITFSVLDTDKQFSLPIGGQITFDRDSMNGGAAPWLLVSNNVIDWYRNDAIIYSIKIDGDAEHAESTLHQVIELTEENPAISRTSKIELAESLRNIKNALTGLSAFLSVVLFTVGILNFINTISVGIISRQKEFAVMEAIGATKRQVQKLIIWEGLWYFIFTLIFLSTLGSVSDYLLFSIVRENLGFGTFHYPFVPIFLYMIILLILCCVIPVVLYRRLRTGSVVKRLRQN